jgi:outer membrane receptor protein involved in Fe transport
VYASLQRPWWTPDPSSVMYFDKRALRVGATVTATWTVFDELRLLGGVDAHRDDAWLAQPLLAGHQQNLDYALLNPDDPTRATLWSVSAFGQAQADTPVANFTLGGRVEEHSVAGWSAVPRLAATRRFDRLTAKLLFSGAYRAPSFENLNISPRGVLVPEQLWVGEAELSYQVTDWAFVSANAYALRIDDPILYTVDPATNSEGYENAGRVGSRGVEAEAQLRGSHGFLRLAYSFAQASPDTTVNAYRLADTTERFRGMPGHKVSVLGHLALPKGASLNGTAWFLSERTALDATLADAVFPSVVVLNLNARWDASETSPAKGLSVTVGVNNLLDQEVPWLQPYDGGHPPLPGRGRDVFLRVGYALAL